MAKRINETRRVRNGATTRGTSDDRTDRALRSAARWLKRRGAQRESRDARQPYNEAASLIMNRVRR